MSNKLFVNPFNSFAFVPNAFLPDTPKGRGHKSLAVLLSFLPVAFVDPLVWPLKNSVAVLMLSNIRVNAYEEVTFMSFAYSPLYTLPSGHLNSPFPCILFPFQSPLNTLPSAHLYSPVQVNFKFSQALKVYPFRI